MTSRRVVGLVLAAGEGRRLGRAKALVTDANGVSWVARSVGTLRTAGVRDVYVVVGASAVEVKAAVPDVAHVVPAADWAEGMGASLRAGLVALADAASDASAVIVMLVDTPDIGSSVVRRLLAYAEPSALARATYAGRPGHPVVIGRAHWRGVVETVVGDQGARAYLSEHGATSVECADISDGLDIDTPEALNAWRVQPSGTTA